MIYGQTNQAVLAELDKLVYGHKQAKIALINLVNRSKTRYHQIWHTSPPTKEEDRVSNINCLLIGESGTGKTHLVQSLAKICEFPLVIIDANQLAPTNASGGISSEQLVSRIKKAAMKKLEENPQHQYFSQEGVMDQTIVFIDEIDKLANSFDSSGSWNKHVQANFLALFENNSALKNVSFIFAGAFAKMKKFIDPKSNKASIGFLSSIDKSSNDFDIESEIIKYGLIPELVGRIHNIVVLDKLEEVDYRRILHKILLPNIKKELKAFNVNNFKLTKSQTNDIITKARNSDMGVRILRKELLKLVQDIEFDYEWNRSTKLISRSETPVDTDDSRYKEIMEVIFNQEPE